MICFLSKHIAIKIILQSLFHSNVLACSTKINIFLPNYYSICLYQHSVSEFVNTNHSYHKKASGDVGKLIDHPSYKEIDRLPATSGNEYVPG